MPGRMLKIRDGDPKITVDGKPLEDMLEEERRKELENDLDHTRRQEIGTKILHKKQFKPRDRYEDDPRRVTRRVRRLSEYEIRKEYGVKVKPFPSLTKNVFYVLFHAGDQKIGSKAISDEVGKPLPDVSSALSSIYNKLKHDNLISRERSGLAYHYTLSPEALERGFETVFRTYYPGQGAVGRRPPGKRTGMYAEVETPFKRASRNAIHILCQDPGKPIKTATIADGLGKPVQNMSSTLKKIWDRLESVGLLKKVGPRNRVSYVLDPLATVGGTKGLIDFLYSHHDHWQKGAEHAQEYFKSYMTIAAEDEEPLKGAAPEAPPPIAAPSEVEVPPVELEIPEEVAVAPDNEKPQVVDPGDMAYLQEKVDMLSQGLSQLVELSKVRDPDPITVESKGAGDFNININVRFLVGRPN